jgi:hypothetical protein
LFLKSHNDLWHCRPRVNWDFDRKKDLDLRIISIIIDKFLESNGELNGD